MKNNQKQVMWLSLLLIFMLCVPVAALAVVEPPAEIYVGDYADVLSEETEQYIIEQNQLLAQETGAQIVVVTVDFLDGMDIEDYAYKIFNDWGIGDKEKNNGLLLLLAIGEENYWAMQGKGLEGVLSSGMLGDYLYEYLEPDFATANYDAGVNKVFNAFLSWFQEYYASAGNETGGTGTFSDNSVSQQNTSRHEKDNGTVTLLLIILIVIAVIVLISMNNRRKDQKRKNDRKNGRNDQNHGSGGGRYDNRDYDEKYGRRKKQYEKDSWDGGDEYQRRSSGRDVIFIPGLFGGSTGHGSGHADGGIDDIGDVFDDIFGGGSSRGGGAGRSSGGFGGFGGSSGGFGGFGGGGFGGGGSRGGGAGRG